MPRKTTTTSADGRRDYFRLENRLVLVAWLNRLFGYERNQDMLKDMADVAEGVDAMGRSHVISRMLLLDWERIHGELVAYREAQGYRNLLIPVGVPRAIMQPRDPAMYELVASAAIWRPERFEGVEVLEGAVVEVLRRYTDSYYRLAQRRWDAAHLEYRKLKDHSVRETGFQNYTVRAPKHEPELVQMVKKLIKEREKRLRDTVRELPNLYFDRHIYQPLLIDGADDISTSPPGLNPGEKRFVEDLRGCCLREKDSLLRGKEIFLLRNPSRGKGIGFFESAGFYPDFVLWVKEGKSQRIVFVEPHGMLHEAPPQANEKVGLHRRLQADAGPALKGLKDVTVDAFVVSRTPYEKLRKKWVHDHGAAWTRAECAAEHVLFPEREADYDYLAWIIRNDVSEPIAADGQ